MAGDPDSVIPERPSELAAFSLTSGRTPRYSGAERSRSYVSPDARLAICESEPAHRVVSLAKQAATFFLVQHRGLWRVCPGRDFPLIFPGHALAAHRRPRGVQIPTQRSVPCQEVLPFIRRATDQEVRVMIVGSGAPPKPPMSTWWGRCRT